MLRQGAPTYDRHWVSEYELDDAKCCAKKRFYDSSWRPEAKSCGDVKSCLFCAAATRRAQDIDDGYKDEEAVAALLIRSRAKGWHNPDSSSIFGFIRSLNNALKGTPNFQKYLSHFGGLRLDKGRVMRAVSRAELNSYYPVMKIDLATNTMYYLVVEDPMNKTYATWLRKLAGDDLPLIGSENTEKLGDIVEAALGLC